MPTPDQQEGTSPVNPENGEMGWSSPSFIVKSTYNTDRGNLDGLRDLIPTLFYNTTMIHHHYTLLENGMVFPFADQSQKCYYAEKNPRSAIPDRMKVRLKGGKTTLSHMTSIYHEGPQTVDSQKKIEVATPDQLERYLKDYRQTTGRIINKRYSVRILEENTRRVFDISLHQDEVVDIDHPEETIWPPVQMKVKYEGDLTGYGKWENKIKDGKESTIYFSILPRIKDLYTYIRKQAQEQIDSSVLFWEGKIRPPQFEWRRDIFSRVTSPQAPSGRTG